MAVGLDELSRIHERAMTACGDAPVRLSGAYAVQLKRFLSLAALRDGRGDPLETVAGTVVAVIRADAFEAGSLRTAILLAAVLLERAGLPAPPDWMAVAAGLAALNYANPGAAVRAVADLLAAEPR